MSITAQLFLFEKNLPEKKILLSPNTETLPGLIQEKKEYIFEFQTTANPDQVNLYLDDIPLEALRSPDRHTARWSWKPGFYAGKFRLKVEFPDKTTIEFDATIDPDRAKLIRNEYDTMVREILQDTLALFSISSYRKDFSRGSGKIIPPIARLEFLKSRFEEIVKVVHEINNRPNRLLRTVDEWVPIGKANYIKGNNLSRAYQSGNIVPVRNEKLKEKLPAKVSSFLPEKIPQTKKIIGLDTKEHQEIKSTLRNWGFWLLFISQRMERSLPKIADSEQKRVRETWILRCNSMSKELLGLQKLPLFTDVSDKVCEPIISSVYRRISSYRKFYSLYKDISLGIENITGSFLQLPLSQTFELYELWCFLRIARVLKERLPGITVDNLFGGLSPDSTSIELPAGNIKVKLLLNDFLCFQKEYVEFWNDPQRQGSFSRRMNPDISFELKRDESVKLIILDAKYRVENQLSDAISSIHMYRDALVMETGSLQQGPARIVCGAYLLSPYIPDQQNNSDWKNSSLQDRLFIRDYRGKFKFGAATLKPGMTLNEIGQTLEKIFEDSEIRL